MDGFNYNIPPINNVIVSDTDEMEFLSDTDSNDRESLFVPPRRNIINPVEGSPSDPNTHTQDQETSDPATSTNQALESTEGVSTAVNPPSGENILADQGLINTNSEPQNSPIKNTVCVTTPKSSKKGSSKESPNKDEDDGQTCSICFESWSISGDHRLASLKCGHIFGKCCVEKWLKAQGSGSRCPQCNAKAHRKDIRVLYVKTLKALDTSEKDKLSNELVKVKTEKDVLAREHAQAMLKSELNVQLVKKLQEELKILKASISKRDIEPDSLLLTKNGQCSKKLFKLSQHGSLCISKDGDCRVMAFNEWMHMLVVSVPSQVSMFPGYGIKKININQMKSEHYLPLHQKQIRDLSFNPHKQNLLLSVGMDKVAKITNVESNSTVQSYETTSPLWSCCWNAEKTHEFFVGTSSGRVLHFSIVDTTGPINTFDVSGSGSIVSMSYVSKCIGNNFPKSGLLVTKLCSICFVELLEDGNVNLFQFPIDGSFTHTSFDPLSNHFLVTSRPSQRFPHARHSLFELVCINVSHSSTVVKNVVSSNEINSLHGGTGITVLSRADKIIRNPAQCEYILICEESSSFSKLYEMASSSLLQRIQLHGKVIDSVCIYSEQVSLVAFLTSKMVTFYRWIEQVQ